MKTISRLICGVLLGMGVLGLIVPVVRADDMADWWAERQRQDEECRRKAQEEREAADRAYREAQAEQAARDRYYYEQQQQREAEARAQADREAWDKYWRDVQAEQEARDRAYWEAQAAQAERDAWYKSQEESRQAYENERKQREWDEWHARMLGTADWSASGSYSTEPYSTGPDVQVARPAGLVILNPFALEKMAPKDQEKVRQEAQQMGQPIMSESENQPIQNPFVPSPK